MNNVFSAYRQMVLEAAKPSSPEHQAAIAKMKAHHAQTANLEKQHHTAGEAAHHASGMANLHSWSSEKENTPARHATAQKHHLAAAEAHRHAATAATAAAKHHNAGGSSSYIDANRYHNRAREHTAAAADHEKQAAQHGTQANT